MQEETFFINMEKPLDGTEASLYKSSHFDW